MTWRDKTCEGCAFRVGVECRRFPPSNFAVVDSIDGSYQDSDYPMVTSFSEEGYMPACAEYAELLPKPQTPDIGEGI